MAGKKKRTTMNRAITLLRESGWRVDVDEANKRIVVRDPLPDVNWFHLFRQKNVGQDEPKDRSSEV